MQNRRFEIKVITLVISIIIIIVSAIAILEAPTDLERWIALLVASAALLESLDEVATRYYSKGASKERDDSSSHSPKRDSSPSPHAVPPTDLEHTQARRRNPFAYFLIIIVSGAVGAGCLALVTAEKSEPWFFVLLLPVLLGSISVALLVDTGAEMEQDPLWQRLISAVLWGALGAPLGLIVVGGALLYLLFKGGSGPPYVDLKR